MADSKFNSKSFNPEAFGKYVERIPKLRRNELIKSRALKGNADIRNAFSSQTGTHYAILPMYGLLDGEALNYDGNTDITATSTTTYERGVIVVGRSKAWVETDFAEDITGGAKFMDNVASQVSGYWEDIDQDTLLCILKGIFSMTGTENLKFVNNHTLDITAVTGNDKDGNPLNCVGPTTLNTAIQKASGDNKSKFSLAIMHSAIATNLENLKLLSYLKYTDENGIQRDLSMGTWNGRVVLVDDNMPVEEVAESSSGKGDGYSKYTTYVLGDGAFDYENIGAKVPYEMARDAKTKGGQDTLYSRQRKVFAPYGISFTKKSCASLSPTNTELETATNWSLVNDGASSNKKYIDHKAIPIARIISRG
ncbi:phage coat protein [Clostridium cadaveris]|uniref:phage coat protein n=1 Tax=Clostridium cadaveris TaxID=1529 RepID=UPI000C089D46|nr:phage coat protein [Clostridium cadaveris]